MLSFEICYKGYHWWNKNNVVMYIWLKTCQVLLFLNDDFYVAIRVGKNLGDRYRFVDIFHVPQLYEDLICGIFNIDVMHTLNY